MSTGGLGDEQYIRQRGSHSMIIPGLRRYLRMAILAGMPVALPQIGTSVRTIISLDREILPVLTFRYAQTKRSANTA